MNKDVSNIYIVWDVGLEMVVVCESNISDMYDMLPDVLKAKKKSWYYFSNFKDKDKFCFEGYIFIRKRYWNGRAQN